MPPKRSAAPGAATTIKVNTTALQETAQSQFFATHFLFCILSELGLKQDELVWKKSFPQDEASCREHYESNPMVVRKHGESCDGQIGTVFSYMEVTKYSFYVRFVWFKSTVKKISSSEKSQNFPLGSYLHEFEAAVVASWAHKVCTNESYRKHFLNLSLATCHRSNATTFQINHDPVKEIGPLTPDSGSICEFFSSVFDTIAVHTALLRLGQVSITFDEAVSYLNHALAYRKKWAKSLRRSSEWSRTDDYDRKDVQFCVDKYSKDFKVGADSIVIISPLSVSTDYDRMLLLWRIALTPTGCYESILELKRGAKKLKLVEKGDTPQTESTTSSNALNKWWEEKGGFAMISMDHTEWLTLSPEQRYTRADELDNMFVRSGIRSIKSTPDDELLALNYGFRLMSIKNMLIAPPSSSDHQREHHPSEQSFIGASSCAHGDEDDGEDDDEDDDEDFQRVQELFS